ncbi:tetratricopeptide repeat protein [Paludisphaera rhizosphaerae]|uniref:tetratricopeptide repeat protein n=1 Tax=Paludisphaera rhizosphaerae TaxID=2711216 RepID=UPI0013EB93C0|nr:tetratricopeptide repeat protein [Paludisphaera rhizosphaerae]
MNAKHLPSILLVAAFTVVTPVLAGGDELVEQQALFDMSHYHDIGWSAFRRGEYELAEFRFSKAIESISPYQKNHLGVTARSYHDLARVLCAQKKFAQAEPLAKWVIEAREHDPRTRDDVLFDAVYLLAVIERELQKDAESVPLFTRAMKIEEKNVGAGSPRLALTIKELADAEARAGDLALADSHYLRAIRIHENANPDSADLAVALDARAQVLDRLGRGQEARAAEARAAAVRENVAKLARRSVR